MPSYLLGKDAVAYWSSTELDGSNTTSVLGSADPAGNIMDLSLEVESEFVDATTRAEAAAGFKSEIAVIKGGRITFDARWQPGDNFFDALKTAWLDSTTITMIALDQDKTVDGAQGLAANFSVSFSKEEPLRDVQKVSVTLAIASYPEWYEVEAAGP